MFDFPIFHRPLSEFRSVYKSKVLSQMVFSIKYPFTPFSLMAKMVIMSLEMSVLGAYSTTVDADYFGPFVEECGTGRCAFPLLKRQVLCFLVTCPGVFQFKRFRAKCALEAMACLGELHGSISSAMWPSTSSFFVDLPN